MSNIPKARRELGRIARRLRAYGEDDAAGRIGDVVERYLHRRPPVRQMPIRSRPLTRRVKEKIIELAENTELHSAEIAAEVGVNPGRVSEVLHGDR
jgi:streptomycin 6-kinase